MTQNSFPFFISFSSGRASLLPVGSWRILILMLYLEGALINSCKRINPSTKETREEACLQEANTNLIYDERHRINKKIIMLPPLQNVFWGNLDYFFVLFPNRM